MGTHIKYPVFNSIEIVSLFSLTLINQFSIIVIVTTN